MVGPGEVDDDLEPEVKEECNGKYGDVISVIVFEVPNAPTPEEAPVIKATLPILDDNSVVRS